MDPNKNFSPLTNGNGKMGRNIFNGITSTPLTSQRSRLLNSLSSPSKGSILRTPPRYSLSETSCKLHSPQQTNSSPLLRSSKYNANLAVYTDTKSPGLHNRIVQYDDKTKHSIPLTHQAKYGSPGLFPVVHFFKRETPVLPKKVMVRLASPGRSAVDVHWYNNSSFKRSISDTTSEVRSGLRNTQMYAETKTRSVLDALREISRKRIHAGSDCENSSDSACKRQKRGDLDLATYEGNKRPREESPKSDSSNPTSPTQQAKRICVVDVLAASFTSSQLLKEKMENVSKRKKEVELEQPNDSIEKKAKQARLSNAETQTNNIENKSIYGNTIKKPTAVEKPTEESIREAEKTNNPDEDADGSSNVFDDRKLEVHRKNKLAMLLGALTGAEPALLPVSKNGEADFSPRENTESKLVSILSPTNKPKHDKHVHFNLTPEVKSIDSLTPVCSDTSVTKASETDGVSTPTKTHLSTPHLVIDTLNTTLPKPKNLGFMFGNSDTDKISTIDLSVSSTNSITTSSSIPSTIAGKTTTSTTKPSLSGELPIKSSEKPESNTLSNLTFSFGVPVSSTKPSLSPTKSQPLSSSTTPTSFGGFKFNLSPSSTSPSSSGPAITFGATPSILTKPDSIPAPKTTSAQSTLFSFGAKSDTTTGSSTTQRLSLSGFNSTDANAAKVSSASTFETRSVGFGSTNNEITPTFNAVVSKPLATALGTTTPATPSTSFLSFPTNSSVSTSITTSAFSFGTKTSSSPTFGVTTSTPGFSGITPTNFIVGSNLTTGYSASVPGYATTTSSIFGTTTTTSGFGTTTSSAFGTTTTTPSGFGTTTASGFGTTTTPSGFGTTTASGFGATTTASGFSIGNGIGAVTTTSGFGGGSSFGTSPGFGLGTAASAFGGTPSTTVPSFNFGTPSSTTTATPTFGITNTTTASGFGSTPGFGVGPSSGSGFGIATTTSSGFGFNTTTVSSSGFATITTTASGFGGFGAPATTSSGFGNSTGFGSATGFGTSVSSSFSGFSSGFVAKPTQTTTASIFGNAAFSTTTTATPAFSTNTAVTGQNLFGSNQNINFSATTTAPPLFGANTTTAKPFSFGSGGNNTSTFNFGGATTTTTSSGFNGNKPIPSFGSTFGSNGFNGNVPATATTTASSVFGTSTSAFGSSSAFPAKPENSFGSTFGNSTFGANNNNNSNNNNPSSSFGGNAVTNAFGSGNNNTFGAATPAFGSSNNNTPSFGFGNGDAPSTFTNQQQPSSSFGAAPSGDTAFKFGGSTSNLSTPAFGSSNPTSNTPGTSSLFAFGPTNPTTTASSSVFSFGSAEQKPNINFSAQNPAGFGAAAPPFGVTATPNFSAGASQFGGPAPGMFSIGSGTGTRQRQHLKAKRRT